MSCSGNCQRFGDYIKQRRRELNLSQAELAGRTGIPQTTLSRFELGRNQPDLEIVVGLSRALEVPSCRLFGMLGKCDQPNRSGLSEIALDEEIQIRLTGVNDRHLEGRELELVKTLVRKMLEDSQPLPAH